MIIYITNTFLVSPIQPSFILIRSLSVPLRTGEQRVARGSVVVIGEVAKGNVWTLSKVTEIPLICGGEIFRIMDDF